ncbi:uncharacterized protein KY384_004886 [Bacidia gigantensis]|uniref:uncharacterized protein n=1 Tax=Bacidia gigantensis TaxID=2732470 RepID=UPI001D0530F0|nr:uncharacterized protein KY384_004886 [Bacidia gigantensis]KAG8530384.1 hypothetical protein KY384_004886 [Bacidia gigantensis]
MTGSSTVHTLELVVKRLPWSYKGHGGQLERSEGEVMQFCLMMVDRGGNPVNILTALQSRLSTLVGAGKDSTADYDNDMIAAKSAGIDAFALNIGRDDWVPKQLQYAYGSAAKNGLSVFLSFDFNWYSIDQATEMATLLSNWVTQQAQLKIGGRAFVSTFAGDGLNVNSIRQTVRANKGVELLVVPNFNYKDLGGADGLFNWMAWPNNGDNKAPSDGNNYSVADGDNNYMMALKPDKPYLLPVSSWFSCHYGLEVPYSKNWVFPSDLLWHSRWNEVLNSGAQWLEILTWNDYGESHYIGPLSSPHSDDGNSKWTNDMPHNGWLYMAVPYIAAFKNGEQKPDAHIENDNLYYWYRPTPKGVECDDTDTCNKPWPSPTPNPNYFMGKPNGAETLLDQVFVVTHLKQPGQLTINSGTNTETFAAPAGASAWAVDMGIGEQSFAVQRNGQNVLSGTSLKNIVDHCICGIYNFNAYVGVLPPGPADALQPAGLAQFTSGLQVSCAPTPSLGTETNVKGPAAMNTASPKSSPRSTEQLAISSSKAAPQGPPTRGTRTISSLQQLSPTNCLQPDDVWAGQAERYLYWLNLNASFVVDGLISQDILHPTEVPGAQGSGEGTFFTDADSTTMYSFGGVRGPNNTDCTNTVGSYNATSQTWANMSVSGGNFNGLDRTFTGSATTSTAGLGLSFVTGGLDDTPGPKGMNVPPLVGATMQYVRLGSSYVLIAVGGYLNQGDYAQRDMVQVMVYDLDPRRWYVLLEDQGVPAPVSKIIGGSPSGQATVRCPINGFNDSAPEVVFGKTVPKYMTSTLKGTSASTNGTTTIAAKTSKSGISPGVIAGIVVGAVVVVAILRTAVAYLVRRRSRRGSDALPAESAVSAWDPISAFQTHEVSGHDRPQEKDGEHIVEADTSGNVYELQDVR